MWHNLKTVLYHGTVSEIQQVNVALGRERKDFGKGFYMVVGPTADDDTALCLKAYWDGLYGKIGSSDAKRILLTNLETENLGIQYFVGKQTVADTLIASITAVDWR